MSGTTPRPRHGGALWPGAARGEPIPPPSPKPLAAPDTRSTWTRPPAPTAPPTPPAPARAPVAAPPAARRRTSTAGWVLLAVALLVVAGVATWVVLLHTRTR